MTGFIVMQRDALDHPLLKDGDRFRAWFWMLARAAWKPTPFDIGGKVITLQRGQLCGSVRQFADAWGMSKSAADRFLTRLKTETMIEAETGHGRLVITICNYAKYQDVEKGDRDSSGTPTGTAPGQQRDIKEQGNKGTIEGEEANASPPSGERDDLFDKGERPPAPDAKPKRKPKPGRTAGVDHPMPLDWRPTLGPVAGKIVAGWPPGMLDREEFAFRSHAEANGRLAKSWNGAFGTWIAKAEERRLENGNGSGNRRQSPGHHGGRDNRDGFQRALDEELFGDGSARRPATGGSGGGGELPLAHPAAVR